MFIEEISAWIQDDDPFQNQLNPKTNDKQKQSLRSLSLCQKKNETQCIFKSNNENENNIKYNKTNIKRKQNSTIEELKKVMEFLTINEQYKYDTHRIFDPNNEKLKENNNKFFNEQQNTQNITRNNKFKIQLDLKENNQPLSKSKRILQPLNENVFYHQKINSERSQNQTSYDRGQYKIISKQQFKFPKFLFQQFKQKNKHLLTEDVINIRSLDRCKQKQKQISINRISSKQDISLTKQQEFKQMVITPKPISTSKYQLFMRQNLLNLPQNSNELIIRKNLNNSTKEKQQQLRIQELSVKNQKLNKQSLTLSQFA